MISDNFKVNDFISTLKIFEIFNFVVANLIICAIFYLLFENKGLITVFLFAFILSFLILKNNYFLEFLLKKTNENSTFKKDTAKKRCFTPWKISWKKFFFVIIKQSFFNISYELFPILIIWIGTVGFVYLIINLFSHLFIQQQILFYYPNPVFFEIITVLGILLGVYQFYLSRHEQKILTKIDIYTKQIQSIIQKETKFDKYQSYLSQDSKADLKFNEWINENSNPKLNFLTLLKAVRKDPEAFEGFKQLIYPRTRDHKGYRQNPTINFQITYSESNKKFEIIEYLATIESRETALKNSYIGFFTSPERIDEIFNLIKQELDLREFGILILSNFNIFHEILLDFISYRFTNELLMTMDQDIDIKKLIQKSETSQEFRSIIEFEIMRRIVKDILI